MEGFQRVELFADANQLDRLASHRADRQCRTAAGVAVELGEDHPGQAESLVEGGGNIDRVLAGHGVGHQQDLARLDRALDPLQLLHQRIIDVQAAGSVEDQRVVAVAVGKSLGIPADGHRILIGATVVHRDIELPAENFQLLDGRRPVDIGRHQQRRALFFAQLQGQFATGGGLAGTLQPAQHDAHRWPRGQIETVFLPRPHEQRQFVAHHADHLLAGGEALQHILADGPLAHRGDEILDDLEVDVSLEECQPHFAQCSLNILLAQPSAPAQLLEDCIEFFAQGIEHGGRRRLLDRRSTLVKRAPDCQEKMRENQAVPAEPAIVSAATAAYSPARNW